MRELLRARLAIRYIFFEMVPPFILGLIIFLFIILMFQSFRLTEYVIVHGAPVESILRILVYLAVSFLPIILPMSLLFAVLLTYGRLSKDSEVVALKALGLNLKHLAIPAVTLALLVSLLSAQTSFYLAPWGNRQMEKLVHYIGQLKPGVAIREGVFSEGFFDLVVYATKVDSKNGLLEKVFIYDERNPNSPLTIIAKTGKLFQETIETGNRAYLELFNGNIHRNMNEVYTRVDFESHKIVLFDPIAFTDKRKTPLSYNLEDLRNALSPENKDELDPKKLKSLEIEFHRRWAISIACFLFALVGVGLGTSTNKRSAKSGGFVLSLGVVIGYWAIYALFESLGKNGSLPVWLAIWSSNIVFLAFTIYSLRKARS